MTGSDLRPDAPRPTPPTSAPAIRTIAMPAHTNPAGGIFGGWLMAQMDLAAGNAAARRARVRCATVAVDAKTFLSPVFVGDEVSLYAEVVSVSRTSMRIEVEAWRRSREGEETSQVTRAAFTFVAIDAERRPRLIPEASQKHSVRRGAACPGNAATIP
jgi:acyl-CoA thioesterase YciA